MRTLISSNILNKFIDTIPESEYKSAWEKITDYRSEANLIKSKSETTFQSEFLAKIFDDVLGYKTSAKHNLKSSNLLVEHKNPNNGEKTDGVIIDSDGEVKVVIELKSIKDTSAAALRNKIRGGAVGKTPMQQAAVYLFQFPKSELAIVSNFDTVIVFNRKEAYTQEWSLFDMDYNEFKEFYLILNTNSFFNGLTNMMIMQSAEADKPIDQSFFIKVASLHKILHNKYKTAYASDLFNKFLGMAILEDCGKLPINLINTIHSRKDDFDHSDSYWGVWTKFFQAMKKYEIGREYLGIDSSIAKMELWQDISYLGRIKVAKSTLDLVVEISKYDLFSIPVNRLFFTISYWINNPYQGVFNYSDEKDDNKFLFEFYSEYLKNNNNTPADLCLTFTCDRYFKYHPLISLYEQVTSNKMAQGDNENLFTLNTGYKPEKEILSLIDKEDLENPEQVSEFIKNLSEIKLVKIEDRDYAIIKLINEKTNTFSIVNDEEKYDVDKKSLNGKIILLTEDDKEWLRAYESEAVALETLATITNEKNANLCFDVDNVKASTRDELGNWYDSKNDIFENKKIYLTTKFMDLGIILVSSMFLKYLRLREPKNFSKALISKHLLSEDFLSKARELNAIRETINLYEDKLASLKMADASETSIIKIEMQLDKFYEQETELMAKND